MVLDSALQGHAAGAKELLAAVCKDPSLLEDPSLASVSYTHLTLPTNREV